ncbi:MAG: tyrosine-type recombinase/integrase [Opitutales bacterium]
MATGKVQVQKYKNRSGTWSWRVTGTVNGERIRKNFASHAEALNEKQHYNDILAQDSRFRNAVTSLTDAQLAEAQDAFDRLAGNYSLRETVDFFLKNYHAPVCDYTVGQVLEDFYADKRAAGVRERTITQLRSTLTRFGEAMGSRQLHEINLEHLQAHIGRHQWSRKTQNNVRADLHAFFEWCRAKPRCWIPANPAHDLPKYKTERGIPEILEVATVKRLMAKAQEEYSGALVPYFALAVFAGIRPQFPDGELGKMALKGEKVWDLVDLENRVIRIPPEVSKTSEYRTVDIQPNLAEWLAPFAKARRGLAGANFEKQYKSIRKAFNLGHDVLRHSFISYHCAMFQSVGGTALQAGNSESIVRRHYLKMVSAKEAMAFWKISPH